MMNPADSQGSSSSEASSPADDRVHRRCPHPYRDINVDRRWLMISQPQMSSLVNSREGRQVDMKYWMEEFLAAKQSNFT
jgi:hypothetical protein